MQTNKSKLTYFMCSDLHGLNVYNFHKNLNMVGFDEYDKNHILVVAGDITDGFGHEYELLEYLRKFSYKRLLIIKGNHDYGGRTGKYQYLNPKSIIPQQALWLKSLPYQRETKDFYLGHGMFLPDNIKLRYHERCAIWGSPILLEGCKKDWWHLSKGDITKLMNKYPTLVDYIDSFDKPIVLGHFDKDTLIKLFKKHHVFYKVCSQGFLETPGKSNKIIWLDRGLIKGDVPKGESYIKRISF